MSKMRPDKKTIEQLIMKANAIDIINLVLLLIDKIENAQSTIGSGVTISFTGEETQKIRRLYK
jgi:hypothetical protein